MASIDKKLKGSTLIEVIVAMIIVTLTFSIGIIIFLNVITSSAVSIRLSAVLLMDQTARETKQMRSYLNEVINEKDIIIHKSILPYENDPLLKLLELKAYDKKGKLLETRKELVNIENETL